MLKEHKPKLMVSAYHRIEDFLPCRSILEVRPDYQVYLRKSPIILPGKSIYTAAKFWGK